MSQGAREQQRIMQQVRDGLTKLDDSTYNTAIKGTVESQKKIKKLSKEGWGWGTTALIIGGGVLGIGVLSRALETPSGQRLQEKYGAAGVSQAGQTSSETQLTPSAGDRGEVTITITPPARGAAGTKSGKNISGTITGEQIAAEALNSGETGNKVDIPWMPDTVKFWYPLIQYWADYYNTDADALAIIILLESGGDHVAGSEAYGLAQIWPTTGKDIVNKLGIPQEYASDYNNPDVSMSMGAYYYASQLNSFKDVSLAAAAYNGGPGTVNNYKEKRVWLKPQETGVYYDGMMELYSKRNDPSFTEDDMITTYNGIADRYYTPGSKTITYLLNNAETELDGSFSDWRTNPYQPNLTADTLVTKPPAFAQK